MISLPSPIALTNCQTGKVVKAEIVELTRKQANAINSNWWAAPSKKARVNEDDHHWPWAKLVGEARLGPGGQYSRCVAVQTGDGAIQGAAIYYLNGQSFLEENVPAVLVDRLATAPWNRDWLVSSPRYRGTGTALLYWVIAHSYDVGFGGRVNLLSVPTSRTVDYYQKLGFVRTGEDDSGMILLELPPDKAVELLHRRGLL